MAFPNLSNEGTYPYICVHSKTNEPHKLAAVFVEFFHHLKHAFASGMNPQMFNGVDVLCLNFYVGVVGLKVLITFDG